MRKKRTGATRVPTNLTTFNFGGFKRNQADGEMNADVLALGSAVDKLIIAMKSTEGQRSAWQKLGEVKYERDWVM